MKGTFPIDRFKNIRTPFYYYDTALLQQTLDVIKAETAQHKGYKVHYAVKANTNPKILDIINKAGLGADCVSGGEIEAAIKAGFPTNEIVYAGVGKSDWEINLALDANIFCFNVESVAELEVINELAEAKGKTACVAFRVNPNVGAHTHANITTGLAENKFGIALEDLLPTIEKASAMKNVSFISDLVLRATYGTTGSQGFSPYQAHSYYTYSLLLPYLSSDGTGANILAMHNENLKWQTTRNTNFALELGLFDHRLTARIEHYNKVTNNLITNISLAPSLGFTTYPENLGKIENKGWEISLSAIPYRNPAKQAYWTVTLNGSHNKDKLVEISEAMRHINEKSTNELKDSPLPRYQEGYSMSSIWVVPSLGIDPATGDEILVKRNGELTNQAGYSGTDAVPYGNTEPTWQGYINSSFTYMGLGVDVSFRYKFGGQVYNQTLVDKVENANLAYNADRRVTQLRWQKPGDHAMFRALNPHGAGTKATSRFVMDENVFQGSTLSFYYRMDTKNARFIKNWGLSSAKLGFTMEDLFYLSSVKRERGLDYPFSRQFTFSLNVAF